MVTYVALDYLLAALDLLTLLSHALLAPTPTNAQQNDYLHISWETKSYT